MYPVCAIFIEMLLLLFIIMITNKKGNVLLYLNTFMCL